MNPMNVKPAPEQLYCGPIRKLKELVDVTIELGTQRFLNQRIKGSP